MTASSNKLREELKHLVEQAKKLPKPKGDIGEATINAIREATADADPPQKQSPTIR